MNSTAPDFRLVKPDLSEVTLADYAGRKKILHIFPCVDGSVCTSSIIRFEMEAAKLENTIILHISADLPLTLRRFCEMEGIENSELLSSFRSTFAKDYGVEIIDSPIKGFSSRAVIALDENNTVIYTQQVEDVYEEPDYEKALAVL